MIGYGSLFLKNKMDHLQVLNINIFLFLFFKKTFIILYLRIQTKEKITLNPRWPLYYF